MTGEERNENKAAIRQQKLEALVFYGVPTGFFFRYGLVMQAEGSEYGTIITVAAFIVGALFVFPIRPIWQPIVAVAIGIGIAEGAQLI